VHASGVCMHRVCYQPSCECTVPLYRSTSCSPLVFTSLTSIAPTTSRRTHPTGSTTTSCHSTAGTLLILLVTPTAAGVSLRCGNSTLR
jgi:hypothetical protein